MAQQESNQQNEISNLLTDFNIRLRDVEEKQSLIKERALLIGENLISIKTETEKNIGELKNNISEINQEIKKMKLTISRIIDKQEEFAKKSQLEILINQFKMFEPLELVRVSDVREIIKEELKNNNIKN